MYRLLPALPVFEDMMMQKIVQAILDNILHHKMPAVIAEQLHETGQVAIGERLAVDVVQDVGEIIAKQHFKRGPELGIERVVGVEIGRASWRETGESGLAVGV